MSKFTVKELWEKRYGNAEEIIDYAGRRILKSACGNPYSGFQPTIDHIRPLSKGGRDVEGNIEICHYDTNAEKGDAFSTWHTNERTFQAKRIKGTSTDYYITEILN